MSESTPGRASQTIDISTDAALKQWSDKLKIPAETLKAAVLAVGPQVERVLEHLGPKSAGRQQDG